VRLGRLFGGALARGELLFDGQLDRVTDVLVVRKHEIRALQCALADEAIELRHDRRERFVDAIGDLRGRPARACQFQHELLAAQGHGVLSRFCPAVAHVRNSGL